MLDRFQITEASDKYRSSMEKIGKALDKYSANSLLDKLYFLEITVYSFLIGNNEMHLKNFSMINSREEWILSPAYDLLNADRQISVVFRRFVRNRPIAEEWVQNSFLSDDYKERYTNLLAGRYVRIR